MLHQWQAIGVKLPTYYMPDISNIVLFLMCRCPFFIFSVVLEMNSYVQHSSCLNRLSLYTYKCRFVCKKPSKDYFKLTHRFLSLLWWRYLVLWYRPRYFCTISGSNVFYLGKTDHELMWSHNVTNAITLPSEIWRRIQRWFPELSRHSVPQGKCAGNMRGR